MTMRSLQDDYRNRPGCRLDGLLGVRNHRNLRILLQRRWKSRIDPPSEKVKSQQAIEPEPKQDESPKEPNPSESTGESGGAGSTISHILK